MFRSIRYLLIVSALLAVGLLAACGSDDDGDDNGSDGNGVEQPANGDDGDNGGDSDDGDAAGAFSDLAAQFGITEVKVTYNISGPGVGGEDSQMVLYSKPPDRWRMDIRSSEGEITMISDGDSTLLCAEEQCFEAPLGDALAIPFLSIFTNPSEFDELVDDTLGVNVERSSREIAGQDAICFSFSGDINGTEGTGEYCFRDDGVLLLLRANDVDGDEDFLLEAIEVSDSVSDSDLEAPYELLDFGDLIP